MPFTLIEPFADVTAELPPPAAFLFEIAHGQHVLRPTCSERRKSGRRSVVADALVRPLDGEGAPVAEAFRAVVADLSDEGLRILHTQPIEAGVLAVQFCLGDGSVTATLRVTRVVHLAFHVESAGVFIAPLLIPPPTLGA